MANIPVFKKIEPIRVHSERFDLIDSVFNLSLGGFLFPQGNQTSLSPAIRIAFIERGLHVLERMFVVEDFKPMITMILNTPLKRPNAYIRTAYMIVRTHIDYIHYKSGYIFKDLFDYCLFEHQQTNANLFFLHNGSTDLTLNQIIAKDPNYKVNTRVFLRSNNYEIGNDMFQYSYFFRQQIQDNVAYYVREEKYEDYFHPILNFTKNFGKAEEIGNIYASILQNPQLIVNFVNHIFKSSSDLDVYDDEYEDESDDDSDDEDQKKKKKTKKERKTKYIGMSLIAKIGTTEKMQEKRIIIGCFICEMMYRLFFDD